MKTLKVILQEVVSGLKAWVNTNTVHQTGNETINGVKTFSDGIVSDVTGSATSVPWSGVTGKPSSYTPASHTHGNITNDGKVGTTANLPLITGTGGAVQAGSFGTSENTFCEGNDSRLSDARTPVAHTHSKADITDLLNSNFIPSANNSYDLGSSSYQWNNLYAKNYYYNGTAWGLDVLNQWTGNNKFVSPNTNFGFKSTTAEAGSLTAASNWIYWQDKNDFQDAYISRDIWGDGSDSLRIAITSKRANGAPSTTGTEVGCGFRLNIHANGNTSIDPFDNGGTDLGTSTNKWKSLNGINPGALSLPSGDSVNIDTTNWDFSWNENYATAPFDGYISIACFGSVLQINNETKFYAMTLAPGADGYICGLLPVSAGDSIKVLVNRTQTSIYEGYKFIKSRGNV